MPGRATAMARHDDQKWSRRFEGTAPGAAQRARGAFVGALLERSNPNRPDLEASALIFGELVGNAVRHAPEGEVLVELDWSGAQPCCEYRMSGAASGWRRHCRGRTGRAAADCSSFPALRLASAFRAIRTDARSARSFRSPRAARLASADRNQSRARPGRVMKMEQLSLLAAPAASARVLVDDASGRIIYEPGVVAPERAAQWFRALRESVPWNHERRPMYDRVVDVPRLTASFNCSEPLPEALAQARALVEARLNTRFNAFGLNLYRDGNDSVAMHNDTIRELLPRSPVALLSLGDPRVMHVQSKLHPRRSFKITLESGSLLLMDGACQENWEHGVPKTRAPVGERISLAFRQRPRQ